MCVLQRPIASTRQSKPLERRFRAALALLVASLVVLPAFAFIPAFNGHPGITRDALVQISRQVEGETLRFSERAVKQVIAGNVDTDCGGSVRCKCNACRKESWRHFDSEDFLTSTFRLMNLKELIIINITKESPDGRAGRQALGEALHTVQDYYSHSNWVNVGFETFDGRLGTRSFDHTDSDPPLLASPSTNTCPDNPDQLGGDGLDLITTGFFDPNDTCKAPRDPIRKCRHGAVSILCLDGISKDHSLRPLFSEARNVAVQGSIDYINQILNDVRVRDNPRAIRALMDAQGRSLTVVMDDTECPACLSIRKAQVEEIVNRVAGSGDDPAKYVLVRYDDTGFSPAFVTANASEFLSAVNALQSHQQMLCPRRSMGALQEALAASEDDSSIFLFADTDTVADTSLVSSVIQTAQAKNIKISPLVFGSSCTNVIPPHYGQVAAGTGGNLLFLFPDTPVFPLIYPHVVSDPAPLLSETATGNGLNNFREFTISLRPGLETATFYVVFDHEGLRGPTELIRPFDEVVQDTDPDVTIESLSFQGKAINVNSPEGGLWRLRQSGFGDFATEAIVKTVGANRAEIVTLTGRPGHEGLFPIQGQPVGTGPHTVLASVGSVQSAGFRLVDLEGNTLQTVDLAQGDPNAAADEFVGTIEQLPTQPFQVAVNGLTAEGVPFERFFPDVFRVQSVEVTHSIDFDAVPAGATTSAFFTVRNAGASGQFSLAAVDSLGLVSAVVPSGVTLNSGDSVVIRVDLTVPLEAAFGSETVLALRATKTTDATITNSAVASLTVGNPVPAIATISPTDAQAGHFGFTLSVTGSNFLSDSVVRWNGADRVTTFLSPTQLQAAIPETDIASPGTAQVTVFNPEPAGGSSNAINFPINGSTPSLTSLSPSFAGPNDPAFTLTVNGQSFVATSVVRWNGSNRTTMFVSQTQLQASISSSDLNCLCTIQVTVSTPNVGTSNALPFSVFRNPLPTATGLSPAGVVAGSPSFTLTVNGSNFVSNSVVRWNGADRTTTFIGSGQLQAAISAGDVATVGTAQVTVFTPTPGGGTSNALTFTINQAPNPVPQVSSLSPNNVVAGSVGGTFTLTVNGSNFISGSVVRWNGQNRSSTFLSATQVRATIPSSDVTAAGTAQVTVFSPTPGGGTSNAVIFTINNPVPALSSMSPSSAMAGDAAFTLVVVGSNFLNGSVVRWNGSNRTTTFIGSSQLRATITMADIASAGSALVTVFNPGPGGGASTALTFAIIEPPPYNECEPPMICD